MSARFKTTKKHIGGRFFWHEYCHTIQRTMRRNHFLTGFLQQYPVIAHVFFVVILLSGIGSSAHAVVKTWPFDTDANYTFDSTKIEVPGNSLADLITQGWYDDCWQYRREIVLDNIAGGAETDFQVLVQFDNTNFDFASTSANGFDIRFTDSDKKTLIDFWRQSYDQAGETGNFWVEIPTLNAAATQSIYIYYGYTCGVPADASAYTDVFFHVGEIGTMTQDPIDGVWDAVAFSQATDVAPVVVSSIQTAVDSPTDLDDNEHGNSCGGGDGFADGTAEPQLRNVTNNGFDINVMTKTIDCDNAHGTEVVGWMALEQGTYYMGDRLFRVFTQVMNKPGGESGQAVNFGYTYDDVPVILPQMQTDANVNATGSVRMYNGTTSSVMAFIEGERDNTTFPNNETIGFVVADQAGVDDVMGANLSDGTLEGEVGSTPEGAMEHVWHDTSFQHVFGAAPIVILKTQNNNGGNNGHERLQNITTTGFQQAFTENFYATSNSYDGIHFNDEGGAFIAIAEAGGAAIPMAGWQYRVPITITNPSAQLLTNFTFKIDLDNTHIDFSKPKADGSDIRFTQSDGATLLNYWYDTADYDPVGETATFYLNIPSIAAGGTYDIYIYYGSTTASSAVDYTNTFTFIGESGVTADDVTQAWSTKNFSGTYTAPPVTVAMMNDYGGSQETHTRTRNVTNTTFQVACEESVDRDGNHTTEPIGYLAMNEGDWVIGGLRFEAHHLTNVDEHYDNISYNYNFGANPSIIAKAITDNNYFTLPGVANNFSSHTRIDSVGTNNFRLQIERCDSDESSNLFNEEVDVIISETGIGDSTMNGMGMEILNTTRDDSFTTLNYTASFSGTPSVGAQIVSEGGGASGDATHIRIDNSAAGSVDIKLEEGGSPGGAHGFEDISVMAVDQGLIYGRQYVDNYPTIAAGAEEDRGPQSTSFLLYARKYAANEPSATVQASEEYNLDPAISPVDVQGVAFEEISSFTETLGPGTGNVQYQISNDGTTWFWWNAGNWGVSDTTYSQSNDQATINANIAQFDNDQGQGTFYFRAILHAPTENDDIALDTVEIDYTIPPPAPDIFGIAPNPYVIGGSVTITGGDFGANQVAVGGKVYFNGCDAGVATAWSDNSITVDVPTCATTGPVTVFANGYLSNEELFTIDTPSITFLEPASGDFFQLVWIYGDKFGFVQGNSYVTFQAGLYAQVISWTNDKIRVVVPSGAVTGNVEVVTAGGTSNGVNFNITPDQSRWPFTYDTRYSYDPSLIVVTGGVAELRPINVPTYYDRHWLYRRPITVSNTTGGALMDFVVEVNLNAGNFSFANARTNGEDIRLTTGDGTTFQNFWVESWDQAGETARLWLRCDDLAAGDNTFFIYYGNSVAPSLSDFSTTLDRLGEVQKNVTSSGTNWVNRTFSNAFSGTPVVYAWMQTQNDNRTAHTRVSGVGVNDFDVKVENSNNEGNSHGNETMGWIALEQGSWLIGDLHVEVDTAANVDENLDTVNFAPAGFNFAAPPGILAIQQTANASNNTTNSTQVRMQNIGANSFQVRIERDDDSQGNYANETLGYIAMDYGTFDNSLPNLNGQMQTSAVDSPNVWYFETVDITSSHTAAPTVLPAAQTSNLFGGEDTCHGRMKTITNTTFQLQLEECTDCTECHGACPPAAGTTEDFAWLAMDAGIIYGHKYEDPLPAAAVGGEQEPIYSNAAPTIEPATDGEYFDGLAGFYELIGFENTGNIVYQVSNDPATATWYWFNGAQWATATVGNPAQANNSIDVNDYIYLFDGQYGTGTFFFKAYLISDGAQLVQVDGIGIIERTEILRNYNWATDTMPPPLFFGDYINVGINPGQEYLLAAQIEHDGATGTYNFQLQYQEDPFGVPGPWVSITAASAKWKAIDGQWGAHNDVVDAATDFTCAAGTGVATDGVYTETGIVNTYEFGSGSYYAEFWYAIQPDATTDNKEYRFRIVNGVSWSNFHYSAYPQTGPPPDPITIAIQNKINVNYTDTPILDLRLTCDDQPNITYGACDVADYMRFGCDLIGVNSVATASYVITPPDYVYDLTAAPPASNCDAADGLKTIYFQAQNERTYLQPNPATDSVILDTVDPDISTATVWITSDQEDYFKGTNDGVTCDPSLAPACTVWFNNKVGQGAGQLLYVTADALPAGNIDQNPNKFEGAVAFGDTPPADNSSAGDWQVDNYSVEVAAPDELGVVFTFTDMVNKTDTFTVDFQSDGESPETIAPGQVTAWDSTGKNTNFNYYQWVNYTNPHFEWSDPLDLPYGVDQSSLFWRYHSWISTDSTHTPATATLANFMTATGPLQNGYPYWLIVMTNDYVTNQSTPTIAFAFRYDGASPTLTYNSPLVGDATIWYSENPGDIIDIDVGWASGSPLINYQYRIGAGVWTDIWNGNQSADYNTDWSPAWASLAEGENQISISALDYVNGATDTYAAAAAGFLYRKDMSAPDHPATATLNGWDTSGKAVAVDEVNMWPYTQPYFEWTPPADNPGGANAGVAGYRVGFSTDETYVPATAEYQTAATYTAATATTDCDVYFLRIRAVDDSSPQNVAAATTGFVYRYGRLADILDNQPGDNTWYSADVADVFFDVDAEKGANCGFLDEGEYTIYSAINGGGVMRKDWTTIAGFGPGYGAQTFTTDWTLDFASLAEGENYVSVRVTDDGGFATYSTDVFYVRIDDSAPNDVAGPANGWASDTKLTVLASGGSYTYDNPYFEWAAPADNPGGGNAGVAGYYVAFSTDPDFMPTATQAGTSYYATPTSCGATYTLIVLPYDAATPTPNTPATTSKIFEYYYECSVVPDYLVVKPEEDGLILEDLIIADWCDDGTDAGMADCTTACISKYCSNTTNKIQAKPDYVKYDDSGANDLTLANNPNDVAAANLIWTWDTVNNRVMLFNDPAVATVLYTPNDGGEKVCVYIYDKDDNLINTGKYAKGPIRLDLSDAPNSGKDITENLSDANQGFTVITDIVGGNVKYPDQIYIRGNLKKGIACMDLTAEDVPNDSPMSPIRIDATYYNPDTSATEALPNLGGTESPAFVYIREGPGVSATDTSDAPAITDVDVIFVPKASSLSLNPVWSHGGDSIGFISRQDNPCGGAAAAGANDPPGDNFNIYLRKHDSGSPLNWTECIRLTSNTTDGMDYYGPLPYSDVAFSTTDDKMIFAATDIGGTGADKLFWVSATNPLGISLGSQYNYVVSDPFVVQDNLIADATAGDPSVFVSFPGAFAVGQQILIGEVNFFTAEFEVSEVNSITAINGGTGELTLTNALSNDYNMMTAGTMGMVMTPVLIPALGQNISPPTDGTYWLDPTWSADDAGACTPSADPIANLQFGDLLAAVRWATPTGFGDFTGTPPGYVDEGNNNPNIIIFYGDKVGEDGDDMYKQDTSKIAKITNFAGNTIWPMKPKWSPDCTKMAFVAWDVSGGVSPSKSSIYIINLADERAGWATATLPVTSLSDTGVYKIYDYADYNDRPAFYPNWSADSTVVAYAVDTTKNLDLNLLSSANDNFVSNMFDTVDFDQYLEYIEDQPSSLGGIISPQIVGSATSTTALNNEFGMAQCPGLLGGSACPNAPNFPYSFVSQTSSDSGNLRSLTLGNVSTVMQQGGLLFLDGVVTAVFPPGVISSDTVFWNDWPTQYCTGAAADEFTGGGAGICPVEPTGEYIVNAGEAREFFPDGTNFSGKVRLIFHYCDNDGDDKVDTGTEGTVSPGYTFDGVDCWVNGVQSATGTIDVDSLGVYNWDDTAGKWDKLEGTVDKVNHTITVYSTHFSRYDTFGFRVGAAPQAVTPLQLLNVHTYPNPWRTTDGVPVRFAADAAAGDGSILVDIKIYDIRGSMVTTVQNVVAKAGAAYPTTNGAVTLAEWNAVNRAGSPLASGVYLYYLQATDLTNGTEVTHKGKLSVIH